MRSAFIESEKSLIDKINSIIEKLNSKKKSPPAVIKLNANLIEILSNTKERIAQVQEKYKNLKSRKNVDEITEIWTKLTESQDQFEALVDQFHENMGNIERKIVHMKTRSETLSELIANLSAANDKGKAQADVLAKIQLDTIVNGTMAIFSLSEAEFDDETRRRQCTEEALRAQVLMLEALGDKKILKMWRNQEDSTIAFLEQVLQLRGQRTRIKQIENETENGWQVLDALTEQYDDEETAEDECLDTLLAIILETKEALGKAQQKVKAPVTDYGLEELVNEIIWGQEKFYSGYREIIFKFKATLKAVFALGNKELPESPVTSCSSSFFSRSASQESLASQASAPSTDSEKSVVFDLQTLCRKRPRSESSQDSEDEDLALLNDSRSAKKSMRL